MPADAAKQPGRLRRFLDSDIGWSFRHSPGAWLSALVLALLVLTALFAPLIKRDDTVLDGDEVAVPHISRRAIARLTEVVHGVQLDEAFATLTQESHREEAHFCLELPLDLVDQRALGGAVGWHHVGLLLAISP